MTQANIDVDQVRADTPGVDRVAHFNNAGASLPTSMVLDTVMDYLRSEAMVGGYETAEYRADALNACYPAAAQLLGTTEDNLAVVESSTRAWNGAFSAIPFTAGDRVLTTRAEYVSNMGGLLYARDRYGVEIDLVPNDEHGQVDVDALTELLGERTRVVSLCHIPTGGGLINPAAEIGARIRAHNDAGGNALFLLDACQSVGQLPVNVDAIGCDILSFTSRKFVRGPRGIGMVWANNSTLAQMTAPAGMDGGGGTWSEPFVFHPHATAKRFEMFELSMASKAGFGVALNYLLDVGVENVAARNAMLAERLRSGLSAIPGVIVRDQGQNQCAICTFTVRDLECLDVKLALRAKDINVSVTQVTSARLDFPTRDLEELNRASLHYYNTEAEIDRLLNAVAEL